MEKVAVGIQRFGYFFKIGPAVLAKRTNDIVGQLVAFVNPAADFAYPSPFAIGLEGGVVRFWLDVLRIVFVSQRRSVRKRFGIENVGDEKRVGTEVDLTYHTARKISVGVFRDVKHMINGVVFAFIVGELVNVFPRLESEIKEKYCSKIWI